MVYDGPLTGITDQFGRAKMLKLQFAEDSPANLERYGKVIQQTGRAVTLEVDRAEVAGALADLLARNAVTDVIVEDPPLEEVIGRIFEAADDNAAKESAKLAEAVT